MYYIMYGKNFKLYGPHACEVNMGANSLQGLQKGHATVHFYNTKLDFKIIWNSFMLYGTAIGQRYINCIGRAYVYEPKSRLVCEIIYNPNDKGIIESIFSKKNNKIDEISGAIYQVNEDFIQELEEHHKFKSGMNKNLSIDPNKNI
jgi:hypothetical protein